MWLKSPKIFFAFVVLIFCCCKREAKEQVNGSQIDNYELINADLDFSKSEFRVACRALDSLKNVNIDGFKKLCHKDVFHDINATENLHICNKIIGVLARFKIPSKKHVDLEIGEAFYNGERTVYRFYTFPFPEPSSSRSQPEYEVGFRFAQGLVKDKITGLSITIYEVD